MLANRNELSNERTSEEQHKWMEKGMANVMYIERPADDHLLYCVPCKREHEGDCPEHGPLIVIQNMKVEENDPDRALHSLPANLMVKESVINGAGLGVFTDTEILPGTTYGPYEGLEIQDIEAANGSVYCWKICKNVEPSHFIDGKDTASSNWMRYVNCALSDLDQNLMAFQYKGEIYYRCIKSILPQTELLVWYGKDCAKTIGIKDKGERIKAVYNGQGIQMKRSDKPVYRCEVCETLFEKKFRYNKHILKHREGAFKCTICDKAFHYASGLEDHMRKHTGETPFMCTTCGKVFKHNRTFHAHMRMHATRNQFKCETCDKRFSDRSNFKKHCRIHTGHKPHMCATCGKTFYDASVLRTHMRTHTNNRVKDGKVSLVENDKFQISNGSHSHVEPSQLSVCDYSLSDKSSLKTCKGTNNDSLSNDIDVLNESNKALSAYENHRHLEPPNSKLSVCNNTLFDKSSLKTSMSTLTDSKANDTGALNECKKAPSANENHRHLESSCTQPPAFGNALSNNSTIDTYIGKLSQDTPNGANVSDLALYRPGMLKQSGEMPSDDRARDKVCIDNSMLTAIMDMKKGDMPHKNDDNETTVGAYFTPNANMNIHSKEIPHNHQVNQKTIYESSTSNSHSRINDIKTTPQDDNVCDKASNDNTDFGDDKKIQTGGKPFICSLCDMTFKHKSQFTRHMLVHTGEKPYKCEVCNKGFKGLSNLKCHVRIHTGEKPFVCKICDKAFKYSSDLAPHMRTHTGEKPYKCGVCDKAFSRSYNCRDHMRKHKEINTTAEKPYENEVCNKAINDNTGFDNSKEKYTEYKPFVCSLCNWSFKHKSLLVRHMMVHTGEKPYKCDVCDKAFSSLSTLKCHKRTHTGERPYVCKICDKAFKYISYLAPHMRTHTGEKPYKCDICDKAFTQSSSLREHMRRHMKLIKIENLSEDGFCDKALNENADFDNSSKMIFTEIKPYLCSLCDRSFKHNSLLTRHMMVHTGEKPFKCEVCDNAFSSLSTLKCHKRIHTGERPYVCKICDKAFKFNSYLRTHMRTHTGEKPYKCDICGKAFSQSSHCHVHMRGHRQDAI